MVFFGKGCVGFLNNLNLRRYKRQKVSIKSFSSLMRHLRVIDNCSNLCA